MIFWILKYPDGKHAGIEWHCGGMAFKVDTLFQAILNKGVFETFYAAQYIAMGTALTPVEIVLTEKV